MSVRSLFSESFQEWKDDDAMQWSAALSYYAALAVAPLLILLLAILGLFWQGPELAQRVADLIEQQAGAQAAEIARMVLRSDEGDEGGLLAGIVSTVLLVVGASGVFGQLQKALNDLWEVEPEKGGVKRMLQARLLGFLMVLGIGMLLLAALVLQTTLSAIAGETWMRWLNQAGSVVVFTVLFAALYKVLPDVDIRWRDVWVGAAATAALFTLGQYLIGLYLGHSSVGSRYGTAGSLVAFLVWLYYSAMVFFYGAEFTQVWARSRGRRIEPVEGARRVREVEEPASGESGGAPDRGTAPGADGGTGVRPEASYP